MSEHIRTVSPLGKVADTHTTHGDIVRGIARMALATDSGKAALGDGK